MLTSREEKNIRNSYKSICKFLDKRENQIMHDMNEYHAYVNDFINGVDYKITSSFEDVKVTIY
jgi:hypothetical protein